MLSKANIPPQDPRISQFLNKVLDEAKPTADQRAAIDKKLDKTKKKIQEKVENAFTVSEYFKQLWEHPELKTEDKNVVIVSLEALQKEKKKMISDNTLQVSKNSANIDDILEKFKMKPYEEHNLQEKIKEMKRKNKFSTDHQLQLDQMMDQEIIRALHRPFRSMQFSKPPEALHYIAGTGDTTQTEVEKKTKAVEFVKKINEDKAVFEKKMKRIEERVEERENDERERFIQREKEMEEQRRIQRKKDVEQNMIKLKARSEARLLEETKWKDEYKSFKTKKPLYQEKEETYTKQVILPELEEKKKKLQNLRNFYKPMDMQEIFQHEKKFLKDLEEKAIQKREASEEEKWIYKKPAYESKYQKVFAEELIKARSQKEDDQAHRVQTKLRVENFLKDYKEKYSPRIDLKKSSASGPSTERNRFDEQGKKNKPRATKDYKKLGDDYMLIAKTLIKKKDIREELLEFENELKNDPTEFNRLANRTIGSPDNVENQNQEQSPKKSTHNYLTELRKMNKLGSSKSQVQLIIKNKDIDKLTRHELLQSEVEKMEEKVRQKEQILKIRNRKRSPGDAAGDYDDVDDMYISSIKAKLGMLNSARS